ncbi:uncharacterized protein LOC132705339 isoform X2 [Cylas formicarius]|uniref:uncharacterized protein LOC132705339 isoform X2 n=1 Tax=Cylas formicarius TaxID=197179 RepID=UPI00295887F1|nr:uncharacterized protein LOC132705339 isoform X2 [Cylas formicarius]
MIFSYFCSVAILVFISTCAAFGETSETFEPSREQRSVGHRMSVIRVGKKFDDLPSGDDASLPARFYLGLRNSKRLQLDTSDRTAPRRRFLSPVRTGKRSIDSDEEIEMKRAAKFVVFPRVGRIGTNMWDLSEFGNSLQKRGDESKSNNGIWFGPRIGRSSDVDEGNYPWTFKIGAIRK